jgi:CheY-like chemotaxis protein
MGKRKTILVVDDNADFLSSLSSLLEQWDYRSLEARSGGDALASLRRHKPDLMLLDWILPDATGLDVLSAIRSDPELAATKTIVITGHSHLANEPILLHGRRILQKPVQLGVLREAIDEAILRRPLEVLIADDMNDVGKAIAFGLRYHGMTVRQCNGGDECVALFSEHRNTIDVVLLDVQMPNLDGPETLAALRQIDPNVKAAFITGNLGKYSSEQLFQAGALRVLQKPILPFTLARDILAMVGK